MQNKTVVMISRGGEVLAITHNTKLEATGTVSPDNGEKWTRIYWDNDAGSLWSDETAATLPTRVTTGKSYGLLIEAIEG